VFIGLGNVDRGDDAVGIRFAADLGRINPKRFFSEEHGLEENVLDILNRKDADTVIFVDACDMGAKPGDIGFLRIEDVGESISTHKVPLSVLMALVRKGGKEPFLLGIQPKTLEFEDDLSDEVATSLNKIEKIVRAATRS
jgi:hydrogenase maturation protease